MNEVLELFYSKEGRERVGFIKGKEIIEVVNISENPNESFMVSSQDILKHKDADATWHTHPNETSNLSDEDYVTIRNWPNMKHYIIGSDGVSCYQYDTEKKAVMEIQTGG